MLIKNKQSFICASERLLKPMTKEGSFPDSSLYVRFNRTTKSTKTTWYEYEWFGWICLWDDFGFDLGYDMTFGARSGPEGMSSERETSSLRPTKSLRGILGLSRIPYKYKIEFEIRKQRTQSDWNWSRPEVLGENQATGNSCHTGPAGNRKQ